jgi:hypothetical protein
MENPNFVSSVIELTNQARAAQGLAPLVLNAKLTTSAQNFSKEMALGDFFSHTSPTGSTPTTRITATGYLTDAGSWRTAENIAAGYSTPTQVVQGWLNSPGHKANILNPDLLEIGVGYYYLTPDTGRVNYSHYWTQNFGTVRGTASAPHRGTNNADQLTGNAGNNSLWGFGGNDTVKGEAGNDIVNGGAGDDLLFGGIGSDRLMGEDGNDRLDGFYGSGSTANQQDFLNGGTGADVFVLGTTGNPYYRGLGFAVVEDFSLASGDRLQLAGKSSDYVLRQENRYVGSSTLDTVIYLAAAPSDPLAVLQDVNLSLSSTSAFTFV